MKKNNIIKSIFFQYVIWKAYIIILLILLVPSLSFAQPSDNNVEYLKISQEDWFVKNLIDQGVSSNGIKILDRNGINTLSKLQNAKPESLTLLNRRDEIKVNMIRRASPFLTTNSSINKTLYGKNAKDILEYTKSGGKIYSDKSIDSLEIIALRNNAYRIENQIRLLDIRRIIEKRNQSYSNEFLNYSLEKHDTDASTPLEENTYWSPCVECDESNSILSPGVYVLYLLDFISKVYQEEFLLLDSINYRFYQRMEDIPLYRGPEQSSSYIQFSNEILENYLASIRYPDENDRYTIWPNRLQGDLFPNNAQQKHHLYHSFFTTNGIPHQHLIEELFDALVNELGTSRTEVKFILLGNPDIKKSYVDKLGLEVVDLDLIDKEVGVTGNRKLTYLEIVNLKKRLYEFNKRKVDSLQLKEFTQEYADSSYREFIPYYSNLINGYNEEIIKCLFKNIQRPIDKFQLDSILQNYSGIAWSCLIYERDCPPDTICPIVANENVIPLYEVQVLYQKYADFYPDKKNGLNSDQFAKWRFDSIHNKLLEHFLGEEMLNKKVPDTIPNSRDIAVARLNTKNYLRSSSFLERELNYLGKLRYLHDRNAYPLFEAAVLKLRDDRAYKLYLECLQRAEKGYHKKLRENLLFLILNEEPYLRGTVSKEIAKSRLADFLFLDLNIIEDYQTTPISFTITRLHSLIQASQFGIARKYINKDSVYSDTLFRDATSIWGLRWQWMNSYAIWHAAMMLTLYPENYTRLSYEFGSPHYKEFLNNSPPNPKGYWYSVDSLNLMVPIGLVQNFEGETFFLATDNLKRINYSVLGSDGESWKPWLKIPVDTFDMPDYLQNRVEDVKLIAMDQAIYLILPELQRDTSLNVYVLRLPFANGGISFGKNDLKKWHKIILDFKLDGKPKEVFGKKAEVGKLTLDRVYIAVGGGDTFEIGFINPNKGKGMVVIPENWVPYKHYYLCTYENDRFNTRERIEPSKKYEQVHRLLNASFYTTTDVLWEFKSENDSIYRKFDDLRLSGNRIVDIDNIDSSRYANSKMFIISPNRYLTAGEYVLKLDVPQIEKKIAGGGSISCGASVKIDGTFVKIFYGKESGEKGALFFTTDIEDPKKKMYLTEPNLSKILINPEHNIFSDSISNGPAAIYNKEALLYIPFRMAKHYDEVQNEPETSSNWLSRIIDYKKIDFPYQHPFFNSNLTQLRKANIWKDYPFALDAMPEDYHKSVFWSKLKIWHAKKLVDWADKEFQIDNVESVNRARELYELAQKVLGIAGESPSDSCALEVYNFFNKAKNYLGAQHTLLGSAYNNYHLKHLNATQEIIISNMSGVAKGAAIEYIYQSSYDKSWPLGSLIDRDRRYNGEYYSNASEKYILNYNHSGDSNKEWVVIKADQPGPLKLLDLPTEEWFIVSGTVINPSSNKPIEGVQIELEGVDTITTSMDGSFLFSCAMNATLYFSKEGYISQQIRVKKADLGIVFLDKTPEGSPNKLDIDKQILVFEIKPFCLPQNPVFKALYWRIESNLEKIRTSRNFAGFQRQLPPYAIPISPERIINASASGGITKYGQLLGANQIPLFRYTALVERAKEFARLAKQYEESLLGLEKEQDQARDDIQYKISQARQDIKLQESNLTLQNSRLAEAFNMRRQAVGQADRTDIQFNHYSGLIQRGNNSWEDAALYSQYTAAAFHATAAAANLVGSLNSPKNVANPTSWFGRSGAMWSSLAASAQSLSGAFQQEASFERREEEWRFQKQLAESDKKIAGVGIELAQDRYNIVLMEKSINSMQLSFAYDQLNYFQNKKENDYEIYIWMRNHLRRIYFDQLGMAIGTARTAQRAIEFEQQTTLDFIGYDYEKYTREEENSGRRYLGASKLLQDIQQLENYKLETATRKKEIIKHISLSAIAPAEFQRFRETGIMNFETVMESFDRDFPGHYMRLINNLELNIIGLIPANQGVNARLINDGFSRIVINPWDDEPTLVYKFPESIALSGASAGTGLFTIQQNDEKLFPFEGNGVAGRWTLEMSKGANPINYNAIADIILTIRYTALEDQGYREKVLKKMKLDESGLVRINSRKYYSLRRDFPDAWYRFHNPICGLAPDSYFNPMMEDRIDDQKELFPNTFQLEINPEDFVPNEQRRTIKKITLAVATSDSLAYLEHYTSIPDALKVFNFELRQFTEPNKPGNVSPLRIKDFFKSTLAFNTKAPYGKWYIQLKQPCDSTIYPIKPKDIQDILFVIDYEAKVHYNR